MPTTEDRKSWFGLGRRPRLPVHLRAEGRGKPPKVARAPRGKIVVRGKRLKGLDEFQRPAFVGRMDRFKRSKERVGYGIVILGFAMGTAIGIWLFGFG